ncbi:MAG: hypothetical protein JW984_12450 [Deltaproteobacteria bacterium]|uniref:Uncharacterized protein n=1 Tax=Candidatus Zymogenus saltonus TaxID=2844893 RepID=A0A9D8KGF2_9DELT|nr:hypothetical protein [Candidatus Zymogenus saltonus]
MPKRGRDGTVDGRGGGERAEEKMGGGKDTNRGVEDYRSQGGTRIWERYL